MCIMPILSTNHMFDHLLESSHRDIRFGDEIIQVVAAEVNFIFFIRSSVISYGLFRLLGIGSRLSFS